MTRSFGPSVYINEATREVEAVKCHWCIFRKWHDGHHACDYTDHLIDKTPREIPNTENTPAWCKMRASYVQDALDMANGVEHKVYRWSGRRTDEERVIYRGIPSDADRQFHLTRQDMKRGTVSLVDQNGALIAEHSKMKK